MNDLDEFLGVALAIFGPICGLVALLTHLEHTLYSKIPSGANQPRTATPEQPPTTVTPIGGEDERKASR